MSQSSAEADAATPSVCGEVSRLDALIISRAHIDDIGRVPLLVKHGFTDRRKPPPN
jgi:predicted metal-dependent RNase